MIAMKDVDGKGDREWENVAQSKRLRSDKRWRSEVRVQAENRWNLAPAIGALGSLLWKVSRRTREDHMRNHALFYYNSQISCKKVPTPFLLAPYPRCFQLDIINDGLMGPKEAHCLLTGRHSIFIKNRYINGT